MSNELLLYIAFILLLAVFGAIFWLREKQINAKFSKFELAIEGLIKENYQLKNDVNSYKSIGMGLYVKQNKHVWE